MTNQSNNEIKFKIYSKQHAELITLICETQIMRLSSAFPETVEMSADEFVAHCGPKSLAHIFNDISQQAHDLAKLLPETTDRTDSFPFQAQG